MAAEVERHGDRSRLEERYTRDDSALPGVGYGAPDPGASPRGAQSATHWLPFALLVALNLLFRLPALLNAHGVHSDAAIVGLQAMHILHGEASRFLWGAGYQGSFDAWVIAALFWFGGPSALKLMLAPFFGHLLLCFFAWSVIGRRITPWKA